MRVSDCVACDEFPCGDVRHECYLIPDISVEPKKIRIVLVSEAAPPDAADYYYAHGKPLFEQTTVPFGMPVGGFPQYATSSSRVCISLRL
jgi:hypothetical protein